MKDRLSIHLNNGQPEYREAVTILRNGGQASQSGLVGITNATYVDGQDPIIPETIFNIQSTGDSNIRFSSGPSKSYRSSLELIGNGNFRSSGLHICYDPELDDSYIESDYGGYGDVCVNPDALDRTVADFSLIRPSGRQGMEFSHISITERGFVGVGLTRQHETRKFHANAPLTVAFMCDGIGDSGTISMHEQSSSPDTTADFGKIYVKPYTVGGRSQAIFFKDDTGNETNLVLSQDLEPEVSSDGLIYGNNGNTYGGWYTPAVRQADGSKSNNTYYGWGAGFKLSNGGSVNCNTLIGYSAGSGLVPSSSNSNVVVGCESLTSYPTASRNIVVGSQSLQGDNTGAVNDSILIGNDLFQTEEPSDGTLAIGIGENPLLDGTLLAGNHKLNVNGLFSIIDESLDTELSTEFEYNGALQRNNVVITVNDVSQGGALAPRSNLRFDFANADGLTDTLLTLDTNFNIGGLGADPPWEASQNRFIRVDGDIRLRQAIRFQDGTSLSGLAELNLVPLNGTSGVNVIVANNKNNLVLDFSELELAGNVSSNIQTGNTFVAVQLDGTDSSNVGKMSLQGLADYISEGQSSIAENCNVLISNPENEINVNTAANARSVMIGCDVAYGASGWKHAVFLGSEAGALATTPNPDLDIDNAAIFIGHRAGFDCDNADNTIGIGTNAGKNSDDASDSIFIGSNAGLDSSYSNSIGIGEHALLGGLGGSGNIEIVTNIDDNNRLMSAAGNVSNKLNIQNVIAGDTQDANLSIGVPRLAPTSPLEVRRETSVHGDNPNDYVQAWYCDGVLVAYVDCDGNFGGQGGSQIEGLLDTAMPAGNLATGTTCVLNIYEDGVATGDTALITNRDNTLFASAGQYVIATRIRGEYRPIWVGC